MSFWYFSMLQSVLEHGLIVNIKKKNIQFVWYLETLQNRIWYFLFQSPKIFVEQSITLQIVSILK